MADDLDWIRQNRDELQKKFKGPVIIVHRQQVLADGHNEFELKQAVASDEHPWDELVADRISSSIDEMLTKIPPDMDF